MTDSQIEIAAMQRGHFLISGSATIATPASAGTLLPSTAHAASGPEVTKPPLGFIALTDAAPHFPSLGTNGKQTPMSIHARQAVPHFPHQRFSHPFDQAA